MRRAIIGVVWFVKLAGESGLLEVTIYQLNGATRRRRRTTGLFPLPRAGGSKGRAAAYMFAAAVCLGQRTQRGLRMTVAQAAAAPSSTSAWVLSVSAALPMAADFVQRAKPSGWNCSAAY